jgi:hypothetical protein
MLTPPWENPAMEDEKRAIIRGTIRPEDDKE